MIIVALLISSTTVLAQKKDLMDNMPCNGNADNMPGKYTDHTHPKYPFSLKGTAQEKAYMTSQLIAIEKTEEASRKNFQLTGCVARVSFSSLLSNNSNFNHTGYGYQLGVYRTVCHATQHIVKTVDEYRTVLRVDVNPTLVVGSIPATQIGIGDFNIGKSQQSVRYQIPTDAVQGPGYSQDCINKPSRVSKYISERMVLTGRSDNYKDAHTDFLKLNNGNGYVENWLGGDRYGNHNASSYQWVDRHYLITQPGIPLLIPVSRKQYLQDMLEYLEIEKTNFYYDVDRRIKEYAGNNADYAKQKMEVLLADKAAYPELYETKKIKIKQLLVSQKADWLQQQAIVGNSKNTYDANDRLKELGTFYDREEEYRSALYVINPEYFKRNTSQPAKPILIEVQFRYELTRDYDFSERLFNNFLKNFDFNALRKIVQ